MKKECCLLGYILIIVFLFLLSPQTESGHLPNDSKVKSYQYTHTTDLIAIIGWKTGTFQIQSHSNFSGKNQNIIFGYGLDVFQAYFSSRKTGLVLLYGFSEGFIDILIFLYPYFFFF